MKGSEARFLGFMEGADKRYIIPVYQRKYDWKLENCSKLYEDLKKIIRNKRTSHFFGSIVSQVVPDGSRIEYHIIDGQQRLTTVTLLLLAMSNLVKAGLVHTEEEDLDQQILHRFIIAPWAKKDDKIKLHPVRDDRPALEKLFGPVEDYDKGSNLTINYQFFYDQILKEEVTIDQLFEAISKLEIISITLDQEDDPQLIFESLNSTGLALTEGDKIRNYVLMGMSPKDQELYYDEYWTKIEKCTGNNVSGFVRDYLSLKTQVTPNIEKVYQSFKQYVEENELPVEKLLSDLLQYARFYERFLTCDSNLHNLKLDNCLYRLNRLEITVTRPFFMEVFRLNQEDKLTTDEVLKVFEITEAYLFRRNICDVPTNALNKIFLNLNKEIHRYDNTANDYVDKLIYSLLSKKESGRFPGDDEFTEALSTKAIFNMRGKYKAYLFERLENYGTVETKDVYAHLDEGTYSIEHIMPQHLSPAWVESLGPNAEEIHSVWLHRLANLTLTGYNPNLSNNPFIEKRDAEEGGYKNSGLRMNQRIAQKDSWGLPELEERNEELIAYARKIWALPSTTFVPSEKEFDSYSLDDESVDLTGRDIVKFSYQNIEQPVTTWADMLEHILKYLHRKDKSVLSSLAYSQSSSTDLAQYISTSPEKMHSAIKVDENIFFEKGTSTTLKLSILRKLFHLYGLDPMDLVFYLRDAESDKAAEEGRYELRKKYWTYALPMIQDAHKHRGSFGNVQPGTSNWCSGYFGVGGFRIVCVANYDDAWVAFWMSSSDAEKNKKGFDLLYAHKEEIEQQIGNTELSWARADSQKASWISYSLKGVSITNESDWPRMAKFHAEWSAKIADAMIPYIEAEANQEKLARQHMIGLSREWAKSRTEKGLITVDLAHCQQIYTRFRTTNMDKLFPDVPGTKSIWGTAGHYYYEVVTRSGNSVTVELSYSSKEMPEDQIKLTDRINEFYPTKPNKKNWDFRLPFVTETISFDDPDSTDEVFAKLDEALKAIAVFEEDVRQKLEGISEDTLPQSRH